MSTGYHLRAGLPLDSLERHVGRRSVDKVACPECQHGISRVLDSRGPKRLRACDACGARFITGETFERRVPRDMLRLPNRRQSSTL